MWKSEKHLDCIINVLCVLLAIAVFGLVLCIVGILAGDMSIF